MTIDMFEHIFDQFKKLIEKEYREILRQLTKRVLLDAELRNELMRIQINTAAGITKNDQLWGEYGENVLMKVPFVRKLVEDMEHLKTEMNCLKNEKKTA